MLGYEYKETHANGSIDLRYCDSTLYLSGTYDVLPAANEPTSAHGNIKQIMHTLIP